MDFYVVTSTALHAVNSTIRRKKKTKVYRRKFSLSIHDFRRLLLQSTSYQKNASTSHYYWRYAVTRVGQNRVYRALALPSRMSKFQKLSSWKKNCQILITIPGANSQATSVQHERPGAGVRILKHLLCPVMMDLMEARSAAGCQTYPK